MSGVELRVRPRDRRGIGVGAGKCVEDATLRFAIEQRLGFVLPVDVDERASDLGEDSGVDRRAVDPGAGARGGDLALEHDHRVVDVDAVPVEQRADLRPLGDVERALDRRAVGTAADHIGAGALAEEKAERSDDDRLPRSRFAGEHVEAGRERQREHFDDREVPDSQLAQHSALP